MIVTPMRATRFEPKRAQFPCYTQPKLNGVRCLWDGREAWTKTLKPHKPHVLRLLKKRYSVPEDCVLDGELRLPIPDYSFQNTTSAVATENYMSPHLQFLVFDVVYLNHPDMMFETRMTSVLVNVETTLIKSGKELEEHHKLLVTEGHEGIIYRTPLGIYRHGSGCRDLMKKKYSEDEEYIILDVWEGIGKFKGMAVFRCLKPGYRTQFKFYLKSTNKKYIESITFGVTPEGSFDHKRQLWQERKNLIGKPLTVRYWDKYESGVPQFPVGVAVRDYE